MHMWDLISLDLALENNCSSLYHSDSLLQRGLSEVCDGCGIGKVPRLGDSRLHGLALRIPFPTLTRLKLIFASCDLKMGVIGLL